MTSIATRLATQRAQIAKTGIIVFAGVLLMTLAAKTQIPFWPVPMTLHTLAVMAFAAILGPRLAVSIFAAYIAAGAAGLPVFSGSPERGIGLAYMAGPTGGYLAGLLIASWTIGTLAHGKALLGRLGAMALGMAIVYACGLAWLSLFVPFDRLLAVGAAPFLAGEAVKIALATVATSLLPASLGGRGTPDA